MGLRQVRDAVSVIARGCLCAAIAAAVAGCATDSKYGVKASTRMVGPGQPVPKGGGTYRVGDPYVIGGKTYVPREDANYRREGQASWYGEDFQGRLTANGEVFDMNGISAAHPTLPLPCYVRVTNLENRRSLVVRVNDRGPYASDRLIDLSVRAAKLLGFYDRGLARVRVEYVGRASLSGSDDTKLAESLRTNEPVTPLVRVAASAQPFASTSPVVAPAFAPTPEHTMVAFGRGLY